jgi:purine-nucleoside phosphorylase
MILGSGLGPLSEEVNNGVGFPSEEVPGWPKSTVEGHTGRLVFGELTGQDVMVLQGRAHYYEGHSMASIGLPIRVMQRMGIEILIVTNAAGAVHPSIPILYQES